MSDSIPASPRPSAFPTPSRNPPGPPSSRSVAILASRGHGATPIPPSLQAKMAAVCTLSISVRSSVDAVLQMANRVPQTPDIDCTTAAFKRVSLGAPTTHLRTPSGGPLRSSSGMAARRNKPLFKLSDITGEPGGGTASAGPAAVVPNDAEWPPRRPAAVTNTPFASFGKIVYALLVLLRLYSSYPLDSDPSGALNFNGKAVVHSSGVDFSNGPSFAINMDQLQLGEELGNGAYGTVKRVLHKPTNVAMAMKVGLSSTPSITVQLIY